MKKLLIIFGILTMGTSFTFAYGPGFPGGGYYYNSQYANQDFATQYNGNVAGYGYGHGRWHKRVYNNMHPNSHIKYYDKRKIMHKRFANRAQFKKITEADARLAVKNAIKSDFPGAKIISIDKFLMPRGIVYSVNAIGADGNKLRFRVNTRGNVVGPFVYNK